jgi:hypothetical protein
MTTDFLVALRVEANALRSKIGTALHTSGQPGPRLTGQAPFPGVNPALGSQVAPGQPLDPKQPSVAHALPDPAPVVGQVPLPQPSQTTGQQRTVPASNPPYSASGYPNLADLDAHSAKLLAMIDAEIRRQPTRQEYEAQMLDRSPLPGETARQTSDRLKAQDFDNPLVARMP